MKYKPFNCQMCDKETVRTSSKQKFCVNCGKINKKLHKRKWDKKYRHKNHKKILKQQRE